MMLGLLYHTAIGFLVKQRSYLRFQPARLIRPGLPMDDQLRHLLQLLRCPAVFLLKVFQPYVHDQHDFASVIVEGNHLVEEHQVHILEALRILCVQLQGGLGILQIIVGEISHQPTGKGGHPMKYGTSILLQNLPDVLSGITGGKASVTHLHLAVGTGDFQLRFVAEKGISAPFFPVLHGLQHITVVRNIFQNPHHLDGRFDIRENLRAYRCGFVITVLGSVPDFLKRWIKIQHSLLLSALTPGCTCRICGK